MSYSFVRALSVVVAFAYAATLDRVFLTANGAGYARHGARRVR